ncbi:MAG: TRAP transporter small permease [Pseudomonadota bacterium]|nr:TRAP transporter small permease [Pseudomonadota bacterium]
MQAFRALCRFHDGITDAGYLIGAFGLASMATIYCYEVLTRYFLGIATDWGNDTFSNLLVITIFSMVPHATRMGQHIAITLLVELFPSLLTALRIFTGIFGIAVCLLAAWMSFEENLRHIELAIVTEQNRPIPKIWMSAWITFGFFTSAFYFLRAMFSKAWVRPISWITPGRSELEAKNSEVTS